MYMSSLFPAALQLYIQWNGPLWNAEVFCILYYLLYSLYIALFFDIPIPIPIPTPTRQNSTRIDQASIRSSESEIKD